MHGWRSISGCAGPLPKFQTSLHTRGGCAIFSHDHLMFPNELRPYGKLSNAGKRGRVWSH